MDKFKRQLITVGGQDQQGSPIAKVFTFNADSRQWEELIPPMPTARHSLSVVTTATTIIATGGIPSGVLGLASTATVEVYSDSTTQWHTAEPLPAPQYGMSSAVIDDSWYLMGGQNCYRASLSSIVQTATSSTGTPCPPSATSSEPLWEYVPPAPLPWSSALGLCGVLMALGGSESDGSTSAAIHAFVHNTWVKLESLNLPYSLS